jgi:hypothetical protein
LLTDAEREAAKRVPAPMEASADGAHLAGEWQRVADTYGPRAPLELLTVAFVEKLRNGMHPGWLSHAALQYPVRERLSLITQPVLLMRPRDELWDGTARAREVLARARCMDLAEQGPALFETAPELVADGISDFLRG